MRTQRLKRRSFLRGAGGIAVALPVLDIMLDDHGTALASGRSLPCRFMHCFGGYTLMCGGDPTPVAVEPGTTGAGYTLPTALSPFAAHGNVQDEITVVSGLGLPTATTSGGTIPEGGRGFVFHFHNNPLISGNRSNTGFANTDVTGPSPDQVMVGHIGGETTFPYLSYRSQALFYSTGGGVDIPVNRDTLSFDNGGNPIAPTVSPRLAYDALFTGFVPPDPAEAAAAAFELRKRKSVLDLVDRDMDGMLSTLGAADQQRIARHLDEIRTLEERLDAIPPDQTGACAQLPDPGDDPPLGGEPSGPGQYDVNLGYSGEDERLRLLSDLMAMAFACDLTRVGSLMMTMWQSFMNIEPITGHLWSAHEVHHQSTQANLTDLVMWHMDHFGRFVAMLRDMPEGDGSVLDRCSIVYLNEGGHGFGYEGGEQYSSHSSDNMVALVAGGAGGLKRGHHVVAPDGLTHPMNVVITAMNAAGANVSTHGEVSGVMQDLFV
ncbi:MAG: DUF1552 domain-containing protein [Myxococcota bacterium]